MTKAVRVIISDPDDEVSHIYETQYSVSDETVPVEETETIEAYD